MTITAKIVTDSVSTEGIRLTTLQLRYPRFIHSEFMTHRVFSRNASSSRAIPVERLIQDVLDDPAMPIHWGKNQRGMWAGEECSAQVELYDPLPVDIYYKVSREDAWLEARDNAISIARAFSQAGYHKQIVNRLLEPFCHINVVCTATEWSNFFALRDHPGAQPEIQVLALAMKQAMAESTPQLLRAGEWHLPYVKSSLKQFVPISVARCARVSYLTQDGKEPNIDQDLALYDRLVGSEPIHASPAEHQATPDAPDEGSKQPHLWGNLRGWCQYRRMLLGGIC